jgi:hypothetical protein
VARRLGVGTAALAALVAPSPASAHVIGVVAVDYRARIDAIRSADGSVQARVVDGDQRLWMRVRPGVRVTVLGVVHEPMIRFDGRRFLVNDRSLTATVDGIAKRTPRRSWRVVSNTSTYMWHDHRLHAGAPVARRGKAVPWRIPLRIDGRPGSISGELVYVAPPRVWLWLVPLFASFAWVAFAIRSAFARSLAPAVLPPLTAAAVVTATVGRRLYGRPGVAAGQYALIAVVAALCLLGLLGLLVARRDLRLLSAVVVGGLGVYVGLGLLPMLYRGLVLAAFSAGVERAAVSIALAGGVATCLVYVLGSDEGSPRPINELPAGSPAPVPPGSRASARGPAEESRRSSRRRTSEFG